MRLKTLCLAALILAVVCVTPASALEYTMDAPDDYLFARPTSDTTIYEHEDPNVDRSKNTALIPPGSGKSFTMKEFITFIALSTNDDIIIIDAEREYGDLVRALRGIVLEISPNSRHHINPLEIARGYGMGENPVALKSELLMSICEQQMGEGQLGAFHKSIIDRCTASVYHDFIKSGGKARQPILSDWRNEIKRQPEREAQELALASELFVEGSLNMFAHETNVDIDSRIIVFDLYEMGDQLKPTALNVTMETIQNRVATNRLAGKYTWVFVDEVYVRPEAA